MHPRECYHLMLNVRSTNGTISKVNQHAVMHQTAWAIELAKMVSVGVSTTVIKTSSPSRYPIFSQTTVKMASHKTVVVVQQVLTKDLVLMETLQVRVFHRTVITWQITIMRITFQISLSTRASTTTRGKDLSQALSHVVIASEVDMFTAHNPIALDLAMDPMQMMSIQRVLAVSLSLNAHSSPVLPTSAQLITLMITTNTKFAQLM